MNYCPLTITHIDLQPQTQQSPKVGKGAEMKQFTLTPGQFSCPKIIHCRKAALEFVFRRRRCNTDGRVRSHPKRRRGPLCRVYRLSSFVTPRPTLWVRWPPLRASPRAVQDGRGRTLPTGKSRVMHPGPLENPQRMREFSRFGS